MSFAWTVLQLLAEFTVLAVVIGGVFAAGCAMGVFC